MPMWTKEQQDAIKLDHSNIIVSAGAGSGKTAVLSERVLRKLKEKVNIDELLILTFTKAAAEEMKERIRKKISKEETLKEQLARIDGAYITTFDSYALSVVKKYNYLLNVSKNIKIIEQSIIDIKKSLFIDEVFNELYEVEDEDFLTLIKDFCTKDDKQIKKYVLDINNKLDMLYDKNDYLENYIKNYFNKDFINDKLNEFENIVLKRVENINYLVSLLEENVDSDYFVKVQETLGELLIANNYLNVKQNIKSLPRLPKDSDEDTKNIKEKIGQAIKELESLCIYNDLNEAEHVILKTKNYVETIIKIIKKLDNKINNYKFEQDLYEFTDIAKMAIKVLEENEKIKEELKLSLNEILIDEYQDTNDLQDKFISLIENNNVYMVGDIKQSIYRFRNANPLLFKTKYDNYSLKNGGLKIDLNKNFRSREEVLNNINLVFNFIMDDFIGGADYKATHQMIFGNLAYNEQGRMEHSNDFEILNYDYDKKSEYSKEEIEIFTIANDIKMKIKNKYQIFDKDTLEKRDIKYSDMAILMDRSTNFYLYKKIFEYLNIPLCIYKDESIVDNMDISIIKNIINLILSYDFNQSFKYSFMSLARSYLFNLDDNEIFKYMVNKNYDESIVYKTVKMINYKQMNPKELMEDIIDKFDIYNKIITVGDIKKHLAIYDYLVNVASDLTEMGYTIKEFYDYLVLLQENKYDITLTSQKEDEGVKIMTIHKSKGLEFPICYYSGLYAKFNISELKERFMYDKTYGIISPCFDNGIRSTIYKDLLKEKYLQEEISEKIRLFYVALTRAKEKMILIASLSDEPSNLATIVPTSERLKYLSFLDILNSIKKALVKYIKKVDLEKLNLTHDYNLIKTTNYRESLEKVEEKLNVKELNLISQVIENKHFSKVSHSLVSKEEKENMEFGTKMHAIFENIDFKNPNYELLNKNEAKVVRKFIESGILENVKNYFKEYEFTYKEDNTNYHGIIDLLLETEDEFKIIDYKLKNTDDEAYINQLMGYKNYIESLTNKKVSIYLYSIILGQLIQKG